MQINVEKEIILGLVRGKSQQEIADELKKKGVTPCSLSSIEKKIKLIKTDFKARTMAHLIGKLVFRGIVFVEEYEDENGVKCKRLNMLDF